MKSYLILVLIIILAAFTRLWDLPHYPAGLNADEAALGYNAYSLIHTGADEHSVSWPLEFRSFDDYKPPLYVYIVLPFVYVLGLTPLAVRLPSALMGILSVYLAYLLANDLFPDLLKSKHKSTKLGLNFGHLVALLLALSPWHLQFSRGGWESNAATTLLILGLVFFLRAFKKPYLFILSSLVFSLSLYCYHSMRVVVPLLLLYLLVWKFHQLRQLLFTFKQRLFLFLAIIIGIAIATPLVFQFTSGSAASRFSGVGLFADSGPLSYVLEQRRLSPQPNSLLTKIKFNRYSAYSFRFLQNYASHFAPAFLFMSGDEIARSKVPGFGQSYLYLLPFFYIGFLLLLLKLKQPSPRLILVWLAISPLAAAFTFQSPHALRAQNMSIPTVFVISLGLITVLFWIKDHLPRFVHLLSLVVLLVVTLTSFKSYLNAYYYRYPQELGYAWQYGFDKLAAYTQDNENRYNQIIVTTSYDQPYILMAFFLKYPPKLLQQELTFSSPDKYGFATGTSFGKYVFKPIDWNTDSRSPNTLIVIGRETPPPNLTPLAVIDYPNGQPVFRIYSTTQSLAKK